MSIQSVVDWHLSEEGGENLNITVQGESGNVTLPENVNLHLFDCEPGTITATKGNNAIFIARSKVTGVVRQEDGTFIAESTEFLEEIFWKRSMRVWVKGSTFWFRVNGEDNSYIDLANCGWDGKGSYALRCLNKTSALVSRGNVTKRTKGLWAEKGSTIVANDVTISTSIGLRAEDNSIIRMRGGQNNAVEVSCELEKMSQIYLSRVSPLIGTTHHVTAKEYSRFHAEGTNFNPTAPTSIQAENQCLIEVVNFDYIKSTGGNCIDLKDNCDAKFTAGYDKIESQGATAIYATDNCRVTVTAVEEIKSLGKHAVHMDTTSKFVASSGTTIKSEAENALRATNKSSLAVRNYDLVQGQKEAVYLSDDSRCWFAVTELIKGLSSDAVTMFNEADISFQNCGTIKGQARNGIYAENNCTVQLQSVELCEGTAGSGIVARTNTNVDVVYAKLIEGKTGYGIDGDNNCDIKVTRSTQVVGETGGIKNTTGGTIISELVTELLSRSGAAVTVTGGDARMKKTKMTGKTTAISSANSTLNFENSNVTGSVSSNNDTIDMERTAITGDVSATSSTVNMQIGSVTGSMNLNNSTLDIERVNAAALALVNSTMYSRLGVFATISLDIASSAFVMKTAGTISGPGNVFNMDGGAVIPGTNQITMRAGATSILIQNALNARIEELAANIMLDTTASGGTVVTDT